MTLQSLSALMGVPLLCVSEVDTQAIATATAPVSALVRHKNVPHYFALRNTGAAS